MKIEINYLEVPERITYLSDWKGLKDELSDGHLILNKKITGCGATSYFLNHPDLRVILCSPRILLLKDKYKKGKSYLHWFRGEEEDLATDDTDPQPKKEEVKKDLSDYKESLKDYLITSEVPKILVTYDSLKYVLETIKESGEDLNRFIVVVDEFHSIFQDCKFKSST